MKNLFLSLAFMLAGGFALANETTEENVKSAKEDGVLGCTETTTTTTTVNANGDTTTCTTRVVKCDTPAELLEFKILEAIHEETKK